VKVAQWANREIGTRWIVTYGSPIRSSKYFENQGGVVGIFLERGVPELRVMKSWSVMGNSTEVSGWPRHFEAKLAESLGNSGVKPQADVGPLPCELEVWQAKNLG
jgi:hypothetical protein